MFLKYRGMVRFFSLAQEHNAKKFSEVIHVPEGPLKPALQRK